MIEDTWIPLIINYLTISDISLNTSDILKNNIGDHVWPWSSISSMILQPP